MTTHPSYGLYFCSFFAQSRRAAVSILDSLGEVVGVAYWGECGEAEWGKVGLSGFADELEEFSDSVGVH